MKGPTVGNKTAKKCAAKTKPEAPAVTGQAAPLDDDLPGMAGGLAGPTPPQPAALEQFTTRRFDDAPPAGPDGEPIDRCPKCGETDGEFRVIRQHGRGGRDPRTGRLYSDITWGVVICSGCGKRRARKTFVEVEPVDDQGGR